jgi:hypothetical protein
MKNIDSVILQFINSNETPFIKKDLKIALIGEVSRKITKDSLVYRLKHNCSLKNITVFTRNHPFTKDMIKDFNLLISVRPCHGESLILNSGINFILLPCNCGNVHTKVCNIIRASNNIKLWAGVEDNNTFAWYVLYNF